MGVRSLDLAEPSYKFYSPDGPRTLIKFWFSPSKKERVQYSMLGREDKWEVNSLALDIPMSILLGLEPLLKLGVGGGWWVAVVVVVVKRHFRVPLWSKPLT